MLEKSSSLLSVLSKVTTTALCNPRDQWFHGFIPPLSVNFVGGYCPACLLKSAPL